MTERELLAGWAFTGTSRKCHYFPEDSSFSVCGKWGFYFGPRQPDDGKPSPDDCSPCRRKMPKPAPGVQPG